MSRRGEQEGMRRPLVSQAEEGRGKCEVNNSLYSAKTMLAAVLRLHLRPAPLYAPSFLSATVACRK